MHIEAIIGTLLVAAGTILFTGCSYSVNHDIRNPKLQTKTWSLSVFGLGEKQKEAVLSE